MNIDFKKPEISFYFSFQCPYSYIAWEVLKNLLKQSKVNVAPIEIGLLPPGNTVYHFPELWGTPRWERLSDEAKKLNITINRPEKYVSAIGAAQAIEAYGSTSACDYINSVFRAVFTSRIDISISAILKQHLQTEGIDSSIYADCQNRPEAAKRATEQLLLWGQKRIRMLPTVEYEDERYSGLIDHYSLERHLRAVTD